MQSQPCAHASSWYPPAMSWQTSSLGASGLLELTCMQKILHWAECLLLLLGPESGVGGMDQSAALHPYGSRLSCHVTPAALSIQAP